MNTSKWIVVSVLILAFAMPAMPVSAQSPSTSVQLTLPTPHPAVLNSDLSLTLALDVANIVPGVAGIDIYIGFDTTYVTPNPAMNVVELLPDFFGPSMVTSVQSYTAGNCPVGPAGTNCIHLVAAGPAQSTRLGAIARFHFLPVGVTAPGTTTCFSVLDPIKLVDSNGNPVVTPPAIPSPRCTPIVPNSIEGIVLRQGTPAVPPGVGTLACSDVKLISGGLVTGTTTTSTTGSFTLFGMPFGSQTLRAEYPGYLASQKVITVGATGPMTVGTTTLRGGDINGDNKINILDVGMIIANFGVMGLEVRSDAGGCGDPDVAADINDDGVINISDLAIIAGSNFGLVGPTPWQ